MSNAYQIGIAVLFAAVIGVAAVVYLKKRAVEEMSEREKADRAAVRRGFRALKPRTVVYRDADDVDGGELEEMARGAASPGPGVRGALAQLLDAARAARRSTRIRGRFPVLARRVGIEGIVLLLVGTIATTSSAVIRAWVTVDGGTGGAVSTLTDIAARSGSFISTIIGMYPAGDLLAALGITGVTLTLSALYDAWMGVGLLLVVAALVIAYLDRVVTPRGPDVAMVIPGVRGREVGFLALAYAVASLAAGIIPVYLADVLGSGGGVAGILGGAASVLVLLVGFIDAVRRGVSRVRDAARYVGRLAAAEYVIRRVSVIVAALGIPVLVGLLVRALDTGRVASLLDVIADSPPGVIAVSAVLAVVVAWMYAPRDWSALGELRDAVSRSMSRAVIRAWAKSKGLPYFGVIAASGVLLGVFRAPLLVGVGGGVVVGALARGVYILFKRVEYASRLRDDGSSALPRAVIEVGRFEDSAGKPLFAARIHGRRLLHRDSGRLAADAARVAEDLLSDRSVRPTESEWAAERAVMDGHVSVEEWRAGLLAATRSDVVDVVSPEADPDDAWAVLRRDRPAEYVASVLESMEKKGTLERRPDRWVYLREA